MYAHGKIFDAITGEMVDVGNNSQEAIARDSAAAVRDKRPRQYFASREEAERAAEPEPVVKRDT